MTCADFDGDGWPDILVANDAQPNRLWINQKDGTFKESGFPLGVAVSEDGAEQGSMGIALGDYDHSGRFNFVWEGFTLEHYRTLWDVPELTSSLKNSLVIAAISTIWPRIAR